MRKSTLTMPRNTGSPPRFSPWPTVCPRSASSPRCSALSRPWKPPEVLGKLIGGALVGTFLGVFVAYGFVGQFAVTLNMAYESESKYYTCMKAGILAYLAGYAPAICVEFSRKSLMSDV